MHGLHVGIVTETYPPEVNGVANTVSRYVQGLSERGHRVSLVRPRQHARDLGQGALLVPGLPLPGYQGLRMGLPAAACLRAHWQAQRPDVLYIATEGLLGRSAMQVAGEMNIPVMSGFHTNFHTYSRHYRIGFLKGAIYAYLRKLHNRGACTVVPTQQLCAELKGHGFANVQVSPRGVDCTLFTPARRDEGLRRKWGAGERERVVLYVGRLAAEKNLPLAIETFRAMQRHDPHLRLVMVGDGPLHRRLAAEHRDIMFTGTQRGETLAACYASADIFLFPSESETYGNVTLEAMASALAVVAFDYAAASNLISHGRNGLLAPLGEHAGFIETACELVSGQRDVETLRSQARKRALSQSWERVLDQFEALLLQCHTNQGGVRCPAEQCC